LVEVCVIASVISALFGIAAAQGAAKRDTRENFKHQEMKS